jgi:RNA polymerase-binding transcription factor DksA
MELGNRSTHSRESTTEPRRKRSRPKDRQQAPTANGNAGTAEPVAGSAVTESQVQRLRQRLLEERSKAMRAIWVKRIDMEEHRSRGELDELDWDIRMVERQGEFIVRVEDALRRLRESPETFNVSEVSGRRIPFERLEFVPWTRRLTEEIDPDEFGV